MSSPNKPVNTFHPSLDPSDILHRQKESLKITIQKAEMEETKRTLRISQQPTKLEKQNLELKFESERQIEKEKINNLLFDLQFLKEKINTGEYSQVLSSRNITSCGNNQGSSNRFAGNIGENDNRFLKTIYNRFDTLDAIFKQNARPRYNEPAEIKKLNLLNQKRVVLNELINVHTQELHRSTGIDYGSKNNISRPYDNKSSTSGESWATFASKNSNNSVKKLPITSRTNINVPKLIMK